MNTTPKIIYRDEHLVAIHKPAGVLTHPSRIAEDDDASAMELLRDHLGSWVYPIHRLDRATSGILLFGLSRDAARRLHLTFERGEVSKRYLAVTRGHAPREAEIHRPLKERRDRITDRHVSLDKPPQAAHSSIQTWAHCTIPVSLGRYPTSRFSLISVKPHTGRRHQIRRHLAGLSYPLIGDTTHGRGELNRYFRQRFSCHRLLLAAIELSLVHPYEDRQLELNASLEGVMARVCHTLFLSPLNPTTAVLPRARIERSDQERGTEGDDDERGGVSESAIWLQEPRLLRQRIASW